MGFGDAYINIQLLTQGFLDPPIIYSKWQNRILPNPKLLQRLSMYRWYIGNLFIFSVHVFSAISLCLLLKNFDIETANKAEKEKIFVYIFTVGITAQAIFTWLTMEKSSGWIAGVESQVFKAFNVENRGWPSFTRQPDIFEMTAYGMAAGFFLFPFSTLVLPIKRSHYDPITQMLETFCPVSLPPKIQKGISIVLYLWSVFFGSISCLNLLLLVMTHCYALSMLAKRNVSVSFECLKKCPSIQYHNKLTITNREITYYELRTLEKVFVKRYFSYCQFRYMISGINIGMGWFKPSSLGVGMSLCITSNYGLLDLLGRLPRILEACMLITTVGFTVLILHLLLYAATPLTYSEMLGHLWRKLKMSKLQRKRVKAIAPVGFTMGQYFCIKKRTALDVIDSILNYTISVLVG